MLRIARTAFAGLLALVGCAAGAADFYAGGSVGSTRFKIDDFSDSGITIHVVDRNDTGFKAFGGAELMPNFAVEAGYVQLGKLKANGIGFGVTVPVTLKASGAFVDAVGLLPLGSGVTLFGKVGVLAGRTETTASAAGQSATEKDSSTNAKLGLGASYALGNVVLRAEWERYRLGSGADKGDADLLSIGVAMRF